MIKVMQRVLIIRSFSDSENYKTFDVNMVATWEISFYSSIAENFEETINIILAKSHLQIKFVVVIVVFFHIFLFQADYKSFNPPVTSSTSSAGPAQKLRIRSRFCLFVYYYACVRERANLGLP